MEGSLNPTPGPWTWHDTDTIYVGLCIEAPPGPGDKPETKARVIASHVYSEEDADFICECRDLFRRFNLFLYRKGLQEEWARFALEDDMQHTVGPFDSMEDAMEWLISPYYWRNDA